MFVLRVLGGLSVGFLKESWQFLGGLRQSSGFSEVLGRVLGAFSAGSRKLYIVNSNPNRGYGAYCKLGVFTISYVLVVAGEYEPKYHSSSPPLELVILGV